MKKSLLFGLLVTISGGLVAQTSPFTPASGLIPGYTANAAFSTDITLSIPATTTIDPSTFGSLPVAVPPFQATIDTVRFTVTGLPAGLTATFDNGTGIYLANETGTVTISGTSSASSGTFVIESLTSGSGDVTVPVVGSLPVTFPGVLTLPVGGSFDLPRAPQAMDGGPYTLGTTGVQELNAGSFDVIQNMPNPFTGTTVIKFSVPVSGNVDFTVFDMIGKRVYAEKIQAQAKINVINFSADKLSSGTYFYSLTSGSKTITKKMIVSGK